MVESDRESAEDVVNVAVKLVMGEKKWVAERCQSGGRCSGGSDDSLQVSFCFSDSCFRSTEFEDQEEPSDRDDESLGGGLRLRREIRPKVKDSRQPPHLCGC